MFEEALRNLLENNSNAIEIEACKIEHAAKGVLEALHSNEKYRALNFLVQMKKSIDRVQHKFSEIEFVIE